MSGVVLESERSEPLFNLQHTYGATANDINLADGEAENHLLGCDRAAMAVICVK